MPALVRSIKIPEGVEEEKESLEYPYWVWNGTLYEEVASLCGAKNLVPKEYFLEAIKTVVGAICGHRITPHLNPVQEAPVLHRSDGSRRMRKDVCCKLVCGVICRYWARLRSLAARFVYEHWLC